MLRIVLKKYGNNWQMSKVGEDKMSKDRFDFGKNWKGFLGNLTENRIKETEKSLQEWLGMTELQGKTFLDIGSGSGLFSLAARNLGAEVFSFDYDDNSVDCTRYLKNKFCKGDKQWHVERGDVLDQEYLSKFKKYDIVYSWGVLHHTGHMWQALENASNLVKDKGILFIAIYNDQGIESRFWRAVKKIYNKCPKVLCGIMTVLYLTILWGFKTMQDFFRGTPFYSWRFYVKRRGMSPLTDAIDWLGGYPFEVAKPEKIFDFFYKRGYTLERLRTVGGGHGCNQFVFKKQK